MRKVYQKIIDTNHGDCMQAAFASLFDLELEQVPQFIEMGEEWWSEIKKFIKQQKHYTVGFLYNGEDVIEEYKLKNLVKYNGVGGYFYAVVSSPKYHATGGTHAIIVDKYCNVIHDPNPEYANVVYPNADIIGSNGILEVRVIESILND